MPVFCQTFAIVYLLRTKFPSCIHFLVYYITFQFGLMSAGMWGPPSLYCSLYIRFTSNFAAILNQNRTFPAFLPSGRSRPLVIISARLS